MRKLGKFLILIIGLVIIIPFFSSLPAQAAGDAYMYLTSERTDYYVGETVRVDVMIVPNGEGVNTIRSILQYDDQPGGEVLLLDDFDLNYDDGFNQSPGRILDDENNLINVGGYVLVDLIPQSPDTLFGTIVFEANQLGSSTITWQEGSHVISPDQVERIDLSACQPITINVIDLPPTNDPPRFDAVSNKTVNPGDTVNFNVRATDANTIDKLIFTDVILPTGATFTNVIDNVGAEATGQFSFTTPDVVGNYVARFIVNDQSIYGPKTDELIVSIGASYPPNRPPRFQPIPEQVVDAGQTVNFEVTATDPDGDNVLMTMRDFEDSSFNITQTGSTSTADFSWTPENFGVYYVVFDAVDDHPRTPLSASLSVRIIVFGGECPPCEEIECEVVEESALTDKLPPDISSPSHPNQNQWYSDAQPQFYWEVYDQDEVINWAYNLNQDSLSELGLGYVTSDQNTAVFTEQEDGFWYFHVKAEYEEGWGPSGHYQIKIDTTPPEFFLPEITHSTSGDLTRHYLNFAAIDQHSGLAYFEGRTDSQDWFLAQSPLYLNDFLNTEDQFLFLRAVDNAGNAIQTTVDLYNLQVLEEQQVTELEEVAEPQPLPEPQPQPEAQPEELLGLDAEKTKSFIDNIMTPALLALAALNALAAALAAGLGFWSWLHLIFVEPLLYLFKRRRKKWGVVYNSLTKMPEDLTVIRLHEQKSNKIVQTKVADSEGRYMFFVKEPGKYYLTVEKPQFDFPSQYLADVEDDGKYLDIYHGEILNIKKRNSPITPNVPIDPEDKEVVPPKFLWRQFVFTRLRFIFSYLGIFLAAIALLINRDIWTLAALFLHICLFLFFRYLIYIKKPKSWGVVKDAESSTPIKNATVRLFDNVHNKLLENTLSDSKGRYAFLVGPNVYQVLADKPGYKKKLIKPVDLTAKNAEKLIKIDIKLNSESALDLLGKSRNSATKIKSVKQINKIKNKNE